MKITQTIENTSANEPDAASPARTTRLLLRLIRAAQPISRADLARRVGVNRSTVTEILKPLITTGLLREEPNSNSGESRLQGRPAIGLSFNGDADFFVGLNLGVRHSQVGLTNLSGEILAEEEFETPADSAEALSLARDKIERLCANISGRKLRTIGVSVPGPANAERRKLLYAPHLDWHDVDIAGALQSGSQRKNVPIIVENDAAAAAMFEARLKMRNSVNGSLSNFILVRSGTGIGVGLVLDNEVYRGAGRARGLAGEFGHMTIVAGGKPCVCGNRGCWEKYASAGAAAALYMGDRQTLGTMKTAPRFTEIIERAEAGEIRARRTLERLGEYLGIGIANVIMGIGVSHVIVSGRLVYGWKYIKEPLREAVRKSMVGRLPGWIIECGEPKGSALGGALEVAGDEFLMKGFIV